MAPMIRLNVRTGVDDDCQLVGSGSDPPKPEKQSMYNCSELRFEGKGNALNKILLTALLSVGTALVYGCRSPGSA